MGFLMQVTVVTLDFGVVGVYANKQIAHREIGTYINHGSKGRLPSIETLENDYGFSFVEQEIIGE